MSGFGTGGMVIAARLADPARPGNLGRGACAPQPPPLWRAPHGRTRSGGRSTARTGASPGLRHHAAGPDGRAHPRQLRAARRVGERSVAGRCQGRLRRRHRRLVRGHGPVPPSARHPDPAHGDHPASEGAARGSARPLRRNPRIHRPGGGRRAGAARSAGDPAPLPGRPRVGAAGGGGAGGHAAAAAVDGGGRACAAAGRPHRPAHPGRPRRRTGGRQGAAQPGRGRPPSGGVRLRARPAPDTAGEQGGYAAYRDRGAGTRAGRSVGRLGARGLGRAARAGDGERRDWTR